jgi:hypothetical protein
MITEDQLKEAFNVTHIGTCKDGGTKTFRVSNTNIGIRLYSTNKSSLISDNKRKEIDIFITRKNLKRVEHNGVIKNVKQLLIEIDKLKSLL